MNLQLISTITQTVKTALSTPNVHFLFIPEKKYVLNQLNVIVNVNNIANENTFDFKEVSRTYSVDIDLIHRQVDSFEEQSIYLRTAMYALEGTANIQSVSLLGDKIEYDYEGEVYKYTLSFEVK